MAKRSTAKNAKKTARKPARKTAKKTAKKTVKKTARRGTGKRTLISPRGDARYIRRDARGRIIESDDVGRSLKQDRARKARTKVKSGYGDRGDQ